uniref:Uncharacterized protein n=1 Tax=Knipowitschia caucasica TaxID=637954 RepID=A0AAV2M0Z7_KNICA
MPQVFTRSRTAPCIGPCLQPSSPLPSPHSRSCPGASADALQQRHPFGEVGVSSVVSSGARSAMCEIGPGPCSCLPSVWGRALLTVHFDNDVFISFQ